MFHASGRPISRVAWQLSTNRCFGLVLFGCGFEALAFVEGKWVPPSLTTKPPGSGSKPAGGKLHPNRFQTNWREAELTQSWLQVDLLRLVRQCHVLGLPTSDGGLPNWPGSRTSDRIGALGLPKEI